MPFAPGDRYRVVEAAVLSPGCCRLCGSARGPFVDTAVSDQWTNHVLYLCFRCLHTIVDNLPEEFHDHEPIIEVVKESEEEAYARAKREIVAVLHDALDDFSPRSDSPAPVPVNSDDPGLPGVSEDHDGEQGSAVSAPEPSGQVSSAPKRRGRNGVPGDSGDESDFANLKF